MASDAVGISARDSVERGEPLPRVGALDDVTRLGAWPRLGLSFTCQSEKTRARCGTTFWTVLERRKPIRAWPATADEVASLDRLAESGVWTRGRRVTCAREMMKRLVATSYCAGVLQKDQSTFWE